MKVQKVRKLFSLLLALVLIFTAISIPVQAESETDVITENSAYLEQLYDKAFSRPDNPIVSQEPYLCADGELAAFEIDDSQSDTTLLTYEDGTTAIASAVPINTQQSSETGVSRAAWPDFLIYSIHGDGNGNITISLASTLITWGTDLDLSLYYGTCRVESANTFRNKWNVTSLGLTTATMNTSISTTKYFRLVIAGVCCGDDVYKEQKNFLMNKKASLYPRYTCPVSGKLCVAPYYTTFKKTASIDWNGRSAYIKWFNKEYSNGKDPWDWGKYHIHHIRPRGFGGLNDYSNLIPLPIDIHAKFTSWWKYY